MFKRILSIVISCILLLSTMAISVSASNYDEQPTNNDIWEEQPIIPDTLESDMESMQYQTLLTSFEGVAFIILSQQKLYAMYSDTPSTRCLMAKDSPDVDFIIYVSEDGQEWHRTVHSLIANSYGWVGIAGVYYAPAYDSGFFVDNWFWHQIFKPIIDYIGPKTAFTNYEFRKPTKWGTSPILWWMTNLTETWNEYEIVSTYDAEDEEKGNNLISAILSLNENWNGKEYIPPFKPPHIKLPDFPDIPSKMPSLEPIDLQPIEGGFTLPPPNTGIDFVDAILAGINAVIEQFVNQTFIVAVNTMIGVAEYGINQAILIYNALNTAIYNTIVVPVYSMLKAIYVSIETMINTLIGTGYGMIFFVIGDITKVTATKTLIEEKLKTLIGLNKVFIGGVLQLTNPLTQSKDLTEDTYQIHGSVNGVSVSGDVIDMQTVAKFIKPLLPVIQGIGWFFLTLAWIKFTTGFIGQPSSEKEDK